MKKQLRAFAAWRAGCTPSKRRIHLIPLVDACAKLLRRVRSRKLQLLVLLRLWRLSNLHLGRRTWQHGQAPYLKWSRFSVLSNLLAFGMYMSDCTQGGRGGLAQTFVWSSPSGRRCSGPLPAGRLALSTPKACGSSRAALLRKCFAYCSHRAAVD